MMLNKFLQEDDPTTLADNIPRAYPMEGSLIDISSFFNSLGGVITLGGFLAFLGILWSLYTVLAYIISLIFLVLYIYAAVRKNFYLNLQTEALRDAEKLYDQLYRGEGESNSRLKDIFTHIESESPNDWKLAIIEADIILDDLLKKRGYAGNSLGERLKSISTKQLESLNDAWEAHKVRNKIAHGGADFILTKHIADETIARYRRVFNEFGIV